MARQFKYTSKAEVVTMYRKLLSAAEALPDVGTWVEVRDDTIGASLGRGQVSYYFGLSPDTPHVSVRTEHGATENARPEDVFPLEYSAGPYQLDRAALMGARIYTTAVKREYPSVEHWTASYWTDEDRDELLFTLDTQTGAIDPDYLGLEAYVVYTEAVCEKRGCNDGA